MTDKKKICASCIYWKPGNFWGCGERNHGVMVESKGWCLFKKNKNGEIVKRKRWNYCSACQEYMKEKLTGFIYQGGGDNTIQEDMSNISELMKEMMENYE